MAKVKSKALRAREALANARAEARWERSAKQDAQKQVALLEAAAKEAKDSIRDLQRQVEGLRRDAKFLDGERMREKEDRAYLQGKLVEVYNDRVLGRGDGARHEALSDFIIERTFARPGWPPRGTARVESLLPITAKDLRYATDEFAAVPGHRREAFERTLALLAAFYSSARVGASEGPKSEPEDEAGMPEPSVAQCAHDPRMGPVSLQADKVSK